MPEEKSKVTSESEAKPKKAPVKPKKAEEAPEAPETSVEAPVEVKEATAPVEEPTPATEESAVASTETSAEEATPPAQVISVSGISELLQPLISGPEVVAQEASEPESQPDSDHQSRLIEFENWAWNNRSATVEEKAEAYKRIVG
jgi:hypothetical protein